MTIQINRVTTSFGSVLPRLQATSAISAKTKKSESRNSSAKKPKALAASVVPVRVFQNQTLNEMGGTQSFLRRISVLRTPEAVARLGNRWYAATNKGSLASMPRGIVIASNFEGHGEIYDKMRAVNPKQETSILRRFTRTSQLATRQHSENVQSVARLFAQTTNLKMEHVKETVFGVGGGCQS